MEPHWSAAVGVLCVIVAVGCGPAVADPDTGGGGEGSSAAVTEGDGSSTTGDSDGPEADCQSVVVGVSAGATSPVIHGAYGYWSQLDGTVWRVALEDFDGAPEEVAAPVDPYTGILVDGGRVLLVEGDVLSWHVLADNTTSILADGQSSPLSPALWNGHVLWLNYGSGILAGSMMRTEVDAPAGPGTLVLDGLGFPRSLAADASGAYVLVQQTPDFLQGVLLEVDPETGMSTVRAADVDGPSAVALTSNQIVWTEQGLEGPGRVRMLGKSDTGLPTTVATVDDGMPIALAADDQAIYYGVFGSSQASVMRVEPTAGAASELVSTWPTAVVDLAISPTHVLVTANPADAALGPVDSVTVFCREAP